MTWHAITWHGAWLALLQVMFVTLAWLGLAVLNHGR